MAYTFEYRGKQYNKKHMGLSATPRLHILQQTLLTTMVNMYELHLTPQAIVVVSCTIHVPEEKNKYRNEELKLGMITQ
ncbi:unnamed protein product [Gongylonema pulchrum]|uniref:Piwi domain-containing protein n=1 Tax=Gongylonema pulchrum TaxID=637853 RepID=A0A183D3G6_9BILA|nr:unnamed protein product [Gongylonema pulchrum]